MRNSDAGRTTLCRQDLELIRNWVLNPNITFEYGSSTTVAGWTAMQNIGRRYQQFFPTLFPGNYSREWYLFRNSNTRQTHASIRGFVDGLFGDGGFEDVEFEEIPEIDFFLGSIFFCPAFIEETATLAEREAFGEGPEVEQLLDEVNRRLGFRGSNQLSFNTIWIMWEWCRFETASEFELSESPIGEASAWCVPFSVAHNAILEYYADLGYYYFTGYGVRNQRLIENLNCGLMQDLLTHIQDDSVDSQVSRIFVTDSQMVQSFLVSLGALRDEHQMNQYNFAQQSFRHWKTTFVTPNAANIAVIRFE